MKALAPAVFRLRHVPILFPLSILASVALLLGGCGGGGDGDDDKQAQIRLLNVSPGYDSLDLYVNDGGSSSTDTVQLSAVAYETASTYSSLKAATYTVKLKRNGNTGTLRSITGDSIGKETHNLYIAYGSTGRFGVLKVSEDQADADANKSSVRVLNTSEAGSLDVYLTDESVALDDATPQFGAIGSGASSSLFTLDSGTYRLRVTGTGDKTDSRLDVSGIVLDSKKVFSVILTGTQGGVLVNAMLVPQQGDLSKKSNTRARVRGAVGIGNGTAVTTSIGGVSLLAGAAVGVISAKYGQVAAGSATVNLRVDGNLVAVPNQTLVAGGDYTLLIWNDASGNRTTLISDDNRLPSTTGKAKIRLMNGLSALAVPATLAVDFSPLAEGIAPGAASGYTEIDSGSDYQLDVSNTSTSAGLFSKSPVSLQDASIYTMFMWGGGATTVSGTLRKDR